MIRSGFLFTHEPRQVETAVYQNTLARCVAVFSVYPGIQAVYQYGGVSAPGISDLDLLLVFAKDAPPIRQDWRTHFNETERYLLLHSPAVISPELLHQGAYITLLQGLQLLWGTPLPVAELEPETAEWMTHLVALEHTVRLLAGTTRQLHIKLVKQRPLLCELNSLRYDLHLMGLTEQWQSSFVQPIQQLRHNWFTLPLPQRKQQLLNLFQSAIEVEYAILYRLQVWAEGLNIVPTQSSAVYPTRWPGITLRSSPIHQRPPALGLLAYLPHAQLREKFLRFVPLEIEISANILPLLSGELLPLFVEMMWQKRQTILCQYHQFLQRLGGGFGSLHVPPFAVV